MIMKIRIYRSDSLYVRVFVHLKRLYKKTFLIL